MRSVIARHGWQVVRLAANTFKITAAQLPKPVLLYAELVKEEGMTESKLFVKTSIQKKFAVCSKEIKGVTFYELEALA